MTKNGTLFEAEFRVRSDDSAVVQRCAVREYVGIEVHPLYWCVTRDEATYRVEKFFKEKITSAKAELDALLALQKKSKEWAKNIGFQSCDSHDSDVAEAKKKLTVNKDLLTYVQTYGPHITKLHDI